VGRAQGPSGAKTGGVRAVQRLPGSAAGHMQIGPMLGERGLLIRCAGHGCSTIGDASVSASRSTLSLRPKAAWEGISVAGKSAWWTTLIGNNYRLQDETANQLRQSRHARAVVLACRRAPRGVPSGARAVHLRLPRWQALSGARVYRVRSREAVCQTRLGRSAKTFGQGQLERATVPEPRPLPLKCAVA